MLFWGASAPGGSRRRLRDSLQGRERHPASQQPQDFQQRQFAIPVNQQVGATVREPLGLIVSDQ